MILRLICPTGHVLDVDAQLAGRKVRCGACGKVMVVPAPKGNNRATKTARKPERQPVPEPSSVPEPQPEISAEVDLREKLLEAEVPEKPLGAQIRPPEAPPAIASTDAQPPLAAPQGPLAAVADVGPAILVEPEAPYAPPAVVSPAPPPVCELPASVCDVQPLVQLPEPPALALEQPPQSFPEDKHEEPPPARPLEIEVPAQPADAEQVAAQLPSEPLPKPQAADPFGPIFDVGALATPFESGSPVVPIAPQSPTAPEPPVELQSPQQTVELQPVAPPNIPREPEPVVALLPPPQESEPPVAAASDAAVDEPVPDIDEEPEVNDETIVNEPVGNELVAPRPSRSAGRFDSLRDCLPSRPEHLPPGVTIPSDDHLQTARQLAAAVAAAAVLSLLPVVIVGSVNPFAAPPWALWLMLMAAVQMVFSGWLVNAPDWATARVQMIVCAAVTTVYAMIMTLALISPANREMIFRLDTVRHGAQFWCGLMFLVMAAATWYSGRTSARWRRELEEDRGEASYSRRL